MSIPAEPEFEWFWRSKNHQKSFKIYEKKWFEIDLKRQLILKQIFNQFWTVFWLQFEIGLPLDPSQEHVTADPDLVINSLVSPMRFLNDVSNKSTTFASKKTPKWMLKICHKPVFTLHRDFSTLIQLSFYPRYLQDRQEASKRSPRCLQAASKMALAVPCKTPK